MKRIFSIGMCIFIGVVGMSCKKESNKTYSTSSITVINGIQGGPSIVATFSDTIMPFYLNQSPISYGSGKEYGISSGSTPLMIVSSDDTSRPFCSGPINLKPGEIYSLYVAGQGKAVDTLLMQETIPVYNDSVSGGRFVNLSAGSLTVSVNLQGNSTTQAEFSNLEYKKVSAFKSYSANSAAPGNYIFEVHDQATGDLLTTFQWNYTLFKNSTLVISGSTDPASPTPISVFPVNNF